MPEIVVMDDGSTDGTPEMVRADYPAVMLHQSATSHGYIVQRNRAAEVASGDVIFSLDDDAAYPSPHTLAQTLAEFDHPRIGAVAIPFINVRQSALVLQRAPLGGEIYVTDAYVGTAHAVRRDVFRRLGGYRASFVHQGEEGDLCARMLTEGYVTRLGRADPLHHFESPKRDLRRMDRFGRRNDVLYAWYNVPWPWLPLHLAMTSFNGLRAGVRLGRPLHMASGLVAGYAAAVSHWDQRRPLPSSVYRLQRRLKKSGSVPLREIEACLPAIQRADGERR